ncbi:MAG: glycine C-acetyltransferase [Verrucomicrobiae bacterium]|nr:glycine C-acetyltransferase [Verrucomicrobiae bacterium]
MDQQPFLNHLRSELDSIRNAGLYKSERVITTPQDAHISVTDRDQILNLCANNYLGLADHPEIVKAATDALQRWGFGMASVRFICGTQEIHRELEAKISAFLGTEDTILYSSCFDANGGLFETLLSAEDAVFSDALNHASVIDGIRLCKAQRFRYANNDMADLEAQLKAGQGARHKLIATDGVFSMDGYIANLPAICDLAEKYGALVMVDDSHATGFTGANGRGTHELHGVMDRVDIITGTLGKALGGASGGFTSGRNEIIELLRQRSRPYLFSNSLAPHVAAASIRAIELAEESTDLRERLQANTAYFREAMTAAGFDIVPGQHPIAPIMLGDARLAVKMADRLLERGIYVIAFSYPVVPKDKARIRVQLSAAHTREDLEFAVAQFCEVRDSM